MNGAERLLTALKRGVPDRVPHMELAYNEPSIIGIARVMQEEIGELLIAARFGGMPERVKIEGEYTFDKSDIGIQATEAPNSRRHK